MSFKLISFILKCISLTRNASRVSNQTVAYSLRMWAAQTVQCSCVSGDSVEFVITQKNEENKILIESSLDLLSD